MLTLTAGTKLEWNSFTDLEILPSVQLAWQVTPDTLRSKGLVSKGALVKVLGRGELNRKVTVKVHAVSKSAEAAITDAGGTVEKLPLPFAVRPAFSGSAHTNR